MIAHVFSLDEEDQAYADFVNNQLETAAWQDRCDPDYEPLWLEETADIPASSAFEFN